MNGNQFVAALIVAQLLVVGGFALGSHVSTDITPDWDAQKTANITCYSWVENGSAEVSCPSVVQVGDGVVRISVELCRNYTVRVDELPPCQKNRG